MKWFATIIAIFTMGATPVYEAPPPHPITDEEAFSATPLVDQIFVPTGKVTVILDPQLLAGKPAPPAAMIEGQAISEEVFLEIQALQKINILNFKEDENFGHFTGDIPPTDYTPTAEVERKRGIRLKGTVTQTDFGKVVSRAQSDHPPTTGIVGNSAVNRAILYKEYRQLAGDSYAIVTQTYHIDLTPEYKEYTDLMHLKIAPDREAVSLLKYEGKQWQLISQDVANKGSSYTTHNVLDQLDILWKQEK